MNLYSWLAFFTSFAAIAAISCLSLAGALSNRFDFWPPPEASSWQHRLFRLLFRVYFLGLVALSVMEFRFDANRLLLGLPLLCAGFGLALYWTNYLGWRNAFGEAESLTTSGIYQFSRNPIYIASIVGMVGWGLLVPSARVIALLAVWTVLYLAAPFLEEPWMLEKFGPKFQKYCENTPRYIGFRSVRI